MIFDVILSFNNKTYSYYRDNIIYSFGMIKKWLLEYNDGINHLYFIINVYFCSNNIEFYLSGMVDSVVIE